MSPQAKARQDAVTALRTSMPSILGGVLGGASPSPEALRAAIEVAKEVGVSLVEIRDAEQALARMEAKGKSAKRKSA